MTHTARKSSPRRPTPGQLSFGMVQAPMSAAGYCGRCNRESRDILRHRASEAHRIGASSLRATPRGASAYRSRGSCNLAIAMSADAADAAYDAMTDDDDDAEDTYYYDGDS